MTEDDIAAGAAAMLQAGSPAFTTHAGATLERISRLARDGDLAGVGSTMLAHAMLHPSDRAGLLKALPAKVLNQYIHLHRGRSAHAIERWRERTPDWAETLQRAAADPERLAAVAAAMADEVGQDETARREPGRGAARA